MGVIHSYKSIKVTCSHAEIRPLFDNIADFYKWSFTLILRQKSHKRLCSPCETNFLSQRRQMRFLGWISFRPDIRLASLMCTMS